jgi:hypothetical protein
MDVIKRVFSVIGHAAWSVLKGIGAILDGMS